MSTHPPHTFYVLQSEWNEELPTGVKGGSPLLPRLLLPTGAKGPPTGRCARPSPSSAAFYTGWWLGWGERGGGGHRELGPFSTSARNL